MINAFAVMQAKGLLEAFQYDPGPIADTEVEIDGVLRGSCPRDVSKIGRAHV